MIFLAYVDDIALFAFNWKETVISVLKEYCNKNYVTFNTNKINVTIFKKNGRNLFFHMVAGRF